MTPSRGPVASEPGLDAESSVRAVRRLYDRWARVYDWNPVLGLVRPARRAAVDAMGLSPGDTVVDMGTGTGANLAFLQAAVGPGGHVIGVDLSPRMLERARRRVARRGWRNVSLVEGDIRDPPIAGPVDGILSAFVVVMYSDPDRLISGWVDRLDPGTIANLYAGPSHRWYGPVVNGLLALYLAAFEEGWSLGDDPGPLEIITARGGRGRQDLGDRADRFEADDLVFGLVRLDVGRFDRGE